MIVSLFLCFLAGCFWGLHEVTAHKWEAVAARHPRLNAWFWNPNLSWQNKYRGRNVAFGRKRVLGIPVPALFTDAKHLLASGTQVALLAAGACAPDPAFTCRYAATLLAFGVAYTIGNILFYSKVGVMRRS